MLPTEIWELIINHINDPCELMKLKCVCRKFNNLIETKLIKSKLWEKLCLEKNILPWKDHIIRKRFPGVINNDHFLSNLHQRTWKKIYHSYKKWSVLPQLEYKHSSCDYGDQFLGENNKNDQSLITCTCVWKNHLAVGTSNGFIYYFTVNHDKPLRKMFVMNNEQALMQIHFWYTDTKKLLMATLSKNYNLKFWDIDKRQIIETRSFLATNICVGLTHRFFSEWNCRITEHEWKPTGLDVKRSFDFCCPNHGDCTRKILAMYHDDKGLILKALADYIFIFTYTIDFLESGKRNITITEFYKLHPESIDASDLFIQYIAINKVAFIANSKHLYILFDGLGTKMTDENYSTRGPYRRFQIPVSSIFMHSNLIIMGLNNGNLCLKYFNEFKDLDTVNFRLELFKTIKVDTKPIISLNITDFNGTPCIIASTESAVHLVHY
ncbi:uncharacterized protein LOC103570622 isoform X1 [Microplitis demolitor]|uniref:uncharacterized protein LOC103570622 isoform X1 n=1 Tax=Microplitis demolitor TaxID=69319 RepID=UPI00044001DD|nr:uncharacterized protein LOC103570622 isoform X1 [Microplitis demolitor]